MSSAGSILGGAAHGLELTTVVTQKLYVRSTRRGTRRHGRIAVVAQREQRRRKAPRWSGPSRGRHGNGRVAYEKATEMVHVSGTPEDAANIYVIEPHARSRSKRKVALPFEPAAWAVDVSVRIEGRPTRQILGLKRTKGRIEAADTRQHELARRLTRGTVRRSMAEFLLRPRPDMFLRNAQGDLVALFRSWTGGSSCGPEWE